MEPGGKQGEFLSVLAHELKAPLSAVEGYLDLLRGDLVAARPELRNQLLERAAVRLSGMRKLIDDLLDLSRIESGQRPRRIAALDAAEVAQWALDTARAEAEARQITLELDAREPMPFLADRSELEIILNNLISNAVKYNRDGGKVLIKLRREGRNLKIQVSDTGIGMSEEELAQLFRAFARVRNEKTQHVLGSGLGLSILRKLALLYRGDVDVVSKPDKGSTFTVTLCEPEPQRDAEKGAYVMPHAS